MRSVFVALSLVLGLMFSTPAFANEFYGRQYQYCIENFVSERACAEGQRKCEEERKEKDKKDESKDKGKDKDRGKKDESKDK